MNKRLEDKLAMLAFGDLTPEETRLLEQEVVGDAEATRILEDYKNMRGGLKAMADIPEHQLSTERLRHAILTQGLKPKPAKPQFGWLWMPAAAAALAFGIVVVRNMNNSPIPHFTGGTVANNSISNLGNDLPDIVKETDNAFAFATASGEIISVQQPAMTTTVRTYRPRTHRSAKNEVDGARVATLRDAIREEFERNASVPPAAIAKAFDKDVPGNAGRRDALVQESPIVLIDSAKDESTGAQRAKELDSASNVLVGG